MTMDDQDALDLFTEAYMVCALWSSTDDAGNPLDDAFDTDDLNDEAQADMLADCTSFYTAHKAEMAACSDDWSQHGHDFWLTRNGHGAGFWDRGYSDKIGDALTKAAHAFGSSDIYQGDDGKLYVM